MSLGAINRRQFFGTSLAAGSVLGAPPATSGLRAGAAITNITPALGCSLAGGMRDRLATDIHDELHVRGLVLDNSRKQLAFALVDSCMVPGDVLADAKRLIFDHTQIPPAHVLISSTHTHSAPPAAHLFQSEADPAYVNWLKVRIADCIRLARNRLQPARIGWGVGSEPSQVFHRRWHLKPGTMPPNPFGSTDDLVKMNPGVGNPNLIKPAGPTDPDVGLLAVETPEGQPIAVLGNYALHYVGGTGGPHVSADYFSYWANAMNRFAGNRFVAMLTNGCSANINNINWTAKSRKRHPPYVKMRQVADIVAAEAYRTWQSIRYQEKVELDASVEELDLAVRLPSEADIAWARQTLASAPRVEQYTEQPHIYAREAIVMAEEFPARFQIPVQTLRVGSLGITAFPVEAFVELGLEVKEKSPFGANITIALANGCYGYCPTVEGHRHGGYETWRAKSSFLEVEAAPKIVASALRQLDTLAKGA